MMVGLALLGGQTMAAEQRLYLAAGGELAVFGIEPETGQLAAIQKLKLEGAGPFERSRNGHFIYAMSTLDRGAMMATLRLRPDGKVALVNQAAVNLRAGYLCVDATGNFVAGNHYGPGRATVWSVAGGIYSGRTIQEVVLEQRSHSAVFSPDNRWLLVPATGPNKVFVNRFDARSGRVVPNDPPFSPGPGGENQARQPRHLIFHPNGRMVYTTNEREKPGVGVWEWDSERGMLTPVQDIVTQPDDFDGKITTADLHLTPDQRFLYLSNRDITQRNAPEGRDSIVGFTVDSKSGRLKLIGHTPCERHPRSFTIDKTGNYIYVAGQVDSKLGSYRIDRDTGRLTRLAQQKVGARPVWVEAIELP